MGKIFAQEDVARNGTQQSPPVPATQGAFDFSAPPLSWRGFFKRLLHGDYKAAGVRIFGGDPESARIALSRILDGRPGRHGDWEWIDLIVETMGPEAERAVVEFVCHRFGFEIPQRLPNAEATREELESVKRTLAEVGAALSQVVKAVEKIEGGVK